LRLVAGKNWRLATHLRHLPDFVDVRAWMVRDGTRIVAEANVALVRQREMDLLSAT